jgi:hypothetical protein
MTSIIHSEYYLIVHNKEWYHNQSIHCNDRMEYVEVLSDMTSHGIQKRREEGYVCGVCLDIFKSYDTLARHEQEHASRRRSLG